MGNNGQDKPKTPEELKAEQLKRYTDNPDTFTENDELIVAVKRTANGSMILINSGATRKELLIALGELTYRIHNILNAMDVEQQKIVQPKGNMFNFARRIK